MCAGKGILSPDAPLAGNAGNDRPFCERLIVPGVNGRLHSCGLLLCPSLSALFLPSSESSVFLCVDFFFLFLSLYVFLSVFVIVSTSACLFV